MHIYAWCFLFQDSLIKPITRIILGVAITTVLITMAVKETAPYWTKKFPPWVLACAVIVFTRIGKRTKDFLEKRGSWIEAFQIYNTMNFPKVLQDLIFTSELWFYIDELSYSIIRWFFLNDIYIYSRNPEVNQYSFVLFCFFQR